MKSIPLLLSLTALAAPAFATAQTVHQPGQNNLAAPVQHAGPTQLTRAEVLQDYHAFKAAGGEAYMQVGYTRPNTQAPQWHQARDTPAPVQVQSSASFQHIYPN